MSQDLSLDDYRKCLAIDKYALDDEFVEQADIYYRVSEATAQAVSLRDTAKSTLARSKAELELELRKQGSVTDARVTDKAIAAKVDSDEDIITLTEYYLETSAQAELWFALKDSFIQRSYMLRNLGSIYIAGYYSDRIIEGKDKQSSDTAYALAKKKLTVLRHERNIAKTRKKKRKVKKNVK